MSIDKALFMDPPAQYRMNPMIHIWPEHDSRLLGTSAYLLRKSASASDACRCPRRPAADAARPLDARPLAGSSPTGI